MSKKITLSKETVRNLTERPMSHEEVTMVGGGGGATLWATCGCPSAECAGSTGCDSDIIECPMR